MSLASSAITVVVLGPFTFDQSGSDNVLLEFAWCVNRAALSCSGKKLTTTESVRFFGHNGRCFAFLNLFATEVAGRFS